MTQRACCWCLVHHMQSIYIDSLGRIQPGTRKHNMTHPLHPGACSTSNDPAAKKCCNNPLVKHN